MIGRKFVADETRRRSLGARRGDKYDPIENDLGVAFVVVIAIAVFMMSLDNIGGVWGDISRDIGHCVHQAMRVAGL